MAQFRVEFVLDPASGKYLAELYHPDRQEELLVRTEAIYPSPEAAALAVVHLFRDAMQETPRAARLRQNQPETKKAGKAKTSKKAKPAKKAKTSQKAKTSKKAKSKKAKFGKAKKRRR